MVWIAPATQALHVNWLRYLLGQLTGCYQPTNKLQATISFRYVVMLVFSVCLPEFL